MKAATGPATALPPVERGRGTPQARNPDGGTMYVSIPSTSRWVEVAQ